MTITTACSPPQDSCPPADSLCFMPAMDSANDELH